MIRELPHGRILVTGGAGFIGSAVVWALNQRGHQDIIISDFLGTSEKWKNLTGLQFSDYLEADDLQSRLDANPAHFGPVVATLHLGACSATTETDAAYLVRNNYEYTKRLAIWALARNSRFVYASSAATYGDGTRGMDDTADITPLRPLNMYGYSKHLFDLHARNEGWNLRIAGLKYFNVYGPNEGHKGDMRSVVHKAFGQIQQTGRMSLFKSYRPEFPDGGQLRDFLYVKDAVAMTLHLAANPGANGLFNLGSGQARSWLELGHALFTALGREPQIDFVEMPDTLRDKYQYFTQADISHLRSTGYTDPVTPLEDAVADYVQNYLVPGRYLETETV